MSGVGKFKLTDALPKNMPGELSEVPGVKGKPKKGKGKKAATGKTTGTHEQTAEQVREARESSKAKNAEASARGHMVDIGRGNQQAGRQKAK